MTDQLNKKYSYVITVENSLGCSSFKGYVYGIDEENAVSNANKIALSSFTSDGDCILRVRIKLTEEYPQLTDNQRLDGSVPAKMSDAAEMLLLTVIIMAAFIILFLVYAYSPMLSHE